MTSTKAETSDLHRKYFDHLLSLDRQGAQRLVDEYLAESNGDVESLYADVLMPAMIHAGQEWEQDRISVAHEHYISEVTRDLIRRIGPRLWAPAEGQRPVALACCAPGERHVLGLMMICDVLRAEGVDVHVLGEGAPAEALGDFAADVAPDLLCLSCALEIHLPETAEVIRLVKSVVPGIGVMVGGAAFGGDPARAQAIGADHYAADVRVARRLIADIVTPRDRA